MQNLNAIYSGDRYALADVRDLLAADSRAALPEWLKKYRPLVADLRAQAATGKSRPCAAPVTLTVVFIDEGGAGQGRLGELLMERIVDPNATGELYPAEKMAGVRTDETWNDALGAAQKYAKKCGFGIDPCTDVRWSIRVLNAGENLDVNTPRHLEAGQELTGRSAGIAFFLGLFALAQADGTRAVWDARKVVEYMVALATFPEAEPRTPDDRLGTLGGTEKKKLAVLKSLPEGTRVVVVFPKDYPESIRIPHDPLPITTVAGLAEELRQRCTSATPRGYLPPNAYVANYIGCSDEVRLLHEALQKGGMHVVSGLGGVGKTVRVVRASEPLWRKGRFPGGLFWIDLSVVGKSGSAADVAARMIATTCGETPKEKADELREQTRRLLAKHRSLILLEAAETVAEGEFPELLGLFPTHATVVWMTQRETDAQHACLRTATHHRVCVLNSRAALELLCDAAGRKVEELSATERANWEEIVKVTECLPVFLSWAGAALRPEWGTTAAEYLAELRADPLRVISGPACREPFNAGQFLRRSLARIAPAAETPDLPAVAERLFAGLAAFHPSHGAPRSLWPLAAGLNTSKSDELRHFKTARRALIGLGLVTSRLQTAGKGSTETLYAVHALARAVATELWRAQPAMQRRAVIDTLGKNAESLVEGIPSQTWLRSAGWVATREALLAHYNHWFEEMKNMDPHARPPILGFSEGAVVFADPPFIHPTTS